MRKIELLVDGWWFSSPNQGVYTYLLELYQVLLRDSSDRINVTFAVRDEKDVPQVLVDRGCSTIRPLGHGRFWRFVLMSVYAWIKGFDKLHTTYFVPLIHIRALPIVVTIHDILFVSQPQFFPIKYRIVRRLLMRLAAHRASAILTISDQSKEDLIAFFSIPEEKIFVAPLGGADRLRSVESVPIQKLINKKYFLTVGRHEPRKNYANLILAFNEYQAAGGDAELVIVGFFSGAFDYNYPKSEGLSFLVNIGESQLKWVYENAKGFIYPSFAEGFGLPLLEALEFCLPCAASRTYPNKSILSACRWTFNPAIVVDMAASLSGMDTGDELKTCMHSKGIELPTWKMHSECMDRLICMRRCNSPFFDRI